MVSEEELEKQMLKQINDRQKRSRIIKGILLIPTAILTIYIPSILANYGLLWLGLLLDFILAFFFFVLTSSSSRVILRSKATSPLIYEKSELRADWDNDKN